MKPDARSILVSLAIFSASAALPSDVAYPTDDRPALPQPARLFAKHVTVCGDVDESQHVERYKGDLGVSKAYANEFEPATLQFQWISATDMRTLLPRHGYGNVAGVRWCTGTLISDRLVLTAGHCFDVQKGQSSWVSPWRHGDKGERVYLLPPELAKLQVANFRYQLDAVRGVPWTPDRFPIVRVVEHREGPDELDYAIVELGPNSRGELPSVSYRPASVVTRIPARAETIAVIQHPRGNPKKIEAGHVLSRVPPNAPKAVYYDDVDTHGGSSGSGVRDAAGAVIAVHTNGGCTAKGGANKGVPTWAIAAVSNVF